MFEDQYIQAINSGATLELTISADRVMLWRPYNSTWFEYCCIQRNGFSWQFTGWMTCDSLPPEKAKPI